MTFDSTISDSLVGRLKQFAKTFLPPAFLRAYRAIAGKNIYHGRFQTWARALNQSTGYNADVILEKVRASTLKVRTGKAAFERDSVLFEKPIYPHAVLAWMLRIAMANDFRLNVLDFGGALGSSYYQCRGFLSELKDLRWSVVEQKTFVDSGKRQFENTHLKFYYSIDDCLEHEDVNVIFLSGVVQYLEDPHVFLEDLVRRGIKYLIFDRTPLASGSARDVLTVQRVPRQIYDASYPIWFFDPRRFLSHFHGKYEALDEFDSFESGELGGTNARYMGFAFRVLGAG